MHNLIASFIICFTCLSQAPVLSITVHKFVYQKDMSEHCRRRVVPSVFLGRRTMEAHSQILHFSKMELPYSCFISIRAESGNNIVLVVQLMSEESLVTACSESPQQLQVHEMGETFGGYWGPLPESVVRDYPSTEGVYTKKTTQATTQTKRRLTQTTPETDNRLLDLPTESKKSRKEDEGDFFTVEVPLVDVSGVLVESDGKKQEVFDSAEAFDMTFDVTPRPRTEYRTKILPVVQFAIKPQSGRRGEEPLFELEYEAPYTEETRITLPRFGVSTTQRKNAFKTNFYVKKIMKYDPTRSTAASSKVVWDHTKANIYFTRYNDNIKSSTSSRIHHTNSTIIKKLNDKHINKLAETKYKQRTKNISSILETISNMKHNSSVYLVTDWSSLADNNKIIGYNMNVTPSFSTFTRTPLKLVSLPSKNIHYFRKSTVHPAAIIKEVKTEFSSSFREGESNHSDNEVSTITKKYDDNPVKITTMRVPTSRELQQKKSQSDSPNTLQEETRSVVVGKNDSYLNDTSYSAQRRELGATSTYGTISPLTGSMVGHESWENVVQAAPVMAVLLNKSKHTSDVNTATAELEDLSTNDNVTTSNKTKVRSKRKIEPISIENARPHNVFTRSPKVSTTTPTSFQLSDMQEFAQMVELHDDELHDRVALRYLRNYVGPSLFNLCNNGEPKARHIFLFNSSRVVIAINNFTLDRMTVMLTPARTLLGAMATCLPDSLECQVYGTRICIDGLNACDGVPNCGAYDIYDEDRLLCGAAVGLQHNVYLAAVTFLALMLTLVYAVHYWLKRCVPKVSEAFFVYTDGAENILYLETIMRSPHDTNEDGTKMEYHRNLYTEDYLYPDDDDDDDGGDKPTSNVVSRLLKACLNGCKYKRKKKQVKQHENVEEDSFCNYNEPRQMYSFTELELNKMTYHTEKTDVSVQTGDSLEMSHIKTLKARESVEKKEFMTQKDIFSRRIAKASVSDVTFEENAQKHVDELEMLNFFKDVRSEPTPSTSRGIRSRSHQLEPGSFEEAELRTHIYDHHLRHELKHSAPTTKTMSSGADVPEPLKQAVKRLRFDEEAIAIPFDYNKDEEGSQQTSNIALADKEKYEDVGRVEDAGAGRDFKRFWKSKKSKKRTHLSLR